MAEELELSDYTTIHELAGAKRTETTGGQSDKSGESMIKYTIKNKEQQNVVWKLYLNWLRIQNNLTSNKHLCFLVFFKVMTTNTRK